MPMLSDCFRRCGPALRVLVLAVPLAASANTGCDLPADGGAPVIGPAAPNASAGLDPALRAKALAELGALSRSAVKASLTSRVAEYQRDAAAQDLAQIRAQRLPNLSFSGSPAAGEYSSSGRSYGFGGTGSATLLVAAPIYDGGRLAANTRYREQMLGASQATVGATRERAVSDALSAVFERDRNRDELEIQRQLVRRVACLSNMIDRVVEVDPGRASEQVQARKALRESELHLENAELTLRRAELRLQRLLAEPMLPSGEAGRALVELPSLEWVLAQIEELPDIRRLRRQADAQAHLAEAAAAERKPQVRWEAGVTATRSPEQYNAHSWRTGFMLSYTLYDFGAQAAAAEAALDRARAARQELEHALEERRNNAESLLDAARTAYSRAARLRELIRDSDQLRRATYRQWAELGRRSLFDLFGAENEHNQVRRAYIEAMYQGFDAAMQLRQLGGGMLPWVAADLLPPVSAVSVPVADPKQ